MSDKHYVPDNFCPVCGGKLDGAFNPDHPEVSPSPGDISVCNHCGQILRFDENMMSQAVSQEELMELPDDERLEIMKYHRFVMQMIEREKEVVPKQNEPGSRIEELWVFVSIDDDGDEGIMAFMSPRGPIPMVATNSKRVEMFLPFADITVDQMGGSYEIRHFVREPDES